MTREEQIKKQADIYTDAASNYTEWSEDNGWSDTNDVEFVEKAFIQGAKWADKNPKFTWISVEEDLPCNHEELIHFDLTNNVLVIDDKQNIFIAFMKKYKDNEWIWDSTNNFVFLPLITHWMPIPEPPKE